MKALLIFALVNVMLALSYLILYIWYSIRRALDRFRRSFR